MADDEKKPSACPGEDQLTIKGPPDVRGQVPFVRHTADHEVLVGLMRPVREGEPLDASSFRLEHRSGPCFAVKPALENTDHKGPAKVSTDAFRNGWDSIFGKRLPAGQA